MAIYVDGLDGEVHQPVPGTNAVLKAAAQRVSRVVGNDGLVARVGDGEFAVLVPNL